MCHGRLRDNELKILTTLGTKAVASEAHGEIPGITSVDSLSCSCAGFQAYQSYQKLATCKVGLEF